MSLLADISPVAPEDYPCVVEVWEASVRATHHFIAESDIEIFRPLVFDELPHVDLACVRDGNGMVHYSGTCRSKAGDKPARKPT